MRREFITKSTSGGCGQFETSPEEIEQEMLTAFCERRQTDRLKTNYRIDNNNNGRNGSFFNVAGYLIEERRRWPVITASPRGQCSK